MHKVIRKGSQLSLTHLLSVVPHLREVRALVNIHSLPRPLLQSLLQPTAPDAQEVQQLQSQDRLPRGLSGYLADSFNDTQREVRPLEGPTSCIAAPAATSIRAVAPQFVGHARLIAPVFI